MAQNIENPIGRGGVLFPQLKPFLQVVGWLPNPTTAVKKADLRLLVIEAGTPPGPKQAGIGTPTTVDYVDLKVV